MVVAVANLDDLVMSCFQPGPIPSNDWKQFMDDMKKVPATRYLGAVLGRVEPTSVQRSELFAFLRERHIKAVGITDEQIVRGFMTAANWVGVDVRGFPWTDLRGALVYLGLTDPSAIARAEKEVLFLRRSVQDHNSSFTRRAV